MANDDILHISEPQEIRVLPSPQLPPYPSQTSLPVITQISPYPVPLIEPGGPLSIPLTVQGTNFRRGELVAAAVDRGDKVKLKTSYVSLQELQAWLPSETWSEHRLRFRLVVNTAAGLCEAEILGRRLNRFDTIVRRNNCRGGEKYGPSVELEVEGVDLLSADVAREQGDFARADAGPRTGAELVSTDEFSSSRRAFPVCRH